MGHMGIFRNHVGIFRKKVGTKFTEDTISWVIKFIPSLSEIHYFYDSNPSLMSNN